MPGRPVLIRIAQVAALAAVAAVALTIILLRSDGDGDTPDPPDTSDWPDPPNEDARVIGEEDGLFVALDDELANPNEQPRIWVRMEGQLDDPGVTEPPPIIIEFEPVNIDFELPDGIPLRFVREISTYLPPSDSEWYEALHGLSLPEGEYDLVIIQAADERILAREDVSIAYTERIDGIAIQHWDALGIVFEAISEPGPQVMGCYTELPFDESAGYWTVICEKGDVTTVWTVDAQTGELTQMGGPPVDVRGES